MNQQMFLAGTIMFGFLITFVICPNYKDVKKKIDLTQEGYNLFVFIFSLFISFMINFLIWGIFL